MFALPDWAAAVAVSRSWSLITFFLNKSNARFSSASAFTWSACLLPEFPWPAPMRLRTAGNRSGIEGRPSYHAALLVVARNDVALNLRVDVGIDETIQCRHAFEHARHILRRHRCHKKLQAGVERSVPVYESNRPTTSHKARRLREQFVSYFSYRCWCLDVEREHDVAPSVFRGIVDLTSRNAAFLKFNACPTNKNIANDAVPLPRAIVQKSTKAAKTATLGGLLRRSKESYKLYAEPVCRLVTVGGQILHHGNRNAFRRQKDQS